jgi:hypothetical protein
MKIHDSHLSRLFKAARLAPPAFESSDLPDHLETRLLARWRAGADAPRIGNFAPVLRWALMGAAAVMLVSIAWASYSPADETATDDMLANYELREELMP